MDTLPPNTFHLPFEVLEVIVCFTDIPEAQNCALTCKALLSQSRANIFSYVRLEPKGDANSYFLRLLVDSPHLEKFVQHVALLDLHTIEQDTTPIVVGIMERLRHLRTISLVNRRVLGCSWRTVPTSMQNVLFKCFQAETLRGVDAQIFSEAHSFMERCPKLQHLEMYEPYHMENWVRSSPAVVPVVLKSFRVSLFGPQSQIGIDAIIGTNGDPIVDFSQLEKLALDSRSTHPAPELLFQTGQWIAQIAHFAADSLAELVWDVGPSDIQSEQLNVTLDTFPCLMKLRVRCRFGLNPDASCLWATRLMLSRNFSPTLQLASFTFCWNNDPGSVCAFIRTVKGAQHITLHFQCTPPSVHPERSKVTQETLDILRETVDARNDLFLSVMSPLKLNEEDRQLNYLRTNRPFVRGKLHQI
ncbi:hypothetical protein DL96DRAFT_418625 [Flagelloscypha sp. PMI_526]|nr:hypothetical protein DL96DRAFT_418625 [Flagelloscypha sp. PMI_526]